ncbi:hypothetical protein THIOKS12350076 [Thiocapsa sp. KS1]|nr:hypothetical protein THIOKS12350076 [Thiocapsa sp. KS1]
MFCDGALAPMQTGMGWGFRQTSSVGGAATCGLGLRRISRRGGVGGRSRRGACVRGFKGRATYSFERRQHHVRAHGYP